MSSGRLIKSSFTESKSFKSSRYYRFIQGMNRTVLYAIIIAAAIAVIFPLAWLFMSSLKNDNELISWPPKLIPHILRWSNYFDVIVKHEFFNYVKTTIILELLFCPTMVFSSAMSGYGFARVKAPGRNILFIIMLASVMIPGIMTFIPQFVVYSRLHLVGTYWPWLLWGLAGNAYNIFLFRQFFASFPKDLEDAAAVDGCSPFRTFWQIFLPNARPIIAVVSIGAFNWVWGDYFNQAMLLQGGDKATLAMKMVSGFVNPMGRQLVTLTLAANVIYVIPMVVLFFIAQKEIVRGIGIATGIKG